MGFSRQEYWSGLPFPSPVDHILPGYWDPISDLKTVHNLPYSWGLGSPTVSSYQLHVAVGNLSSIPNSLKHVSGLLILEAPSVFSCPDLIMIQNFSMMDRLWREGKGDKAHEGKISWVSSLISTGVLESRDYRKQEQTHCSNKCLLTSASTVLSRSSRK